MRIAFAPVSKLPAVPSALTSLAARLDVTTICESRFSVRGAKSILEITRAERFEEAHSRVKAALKRSSTLVLVETDMSVSDWNGKEMEEITRSDGFASPPCISRGGKGATEDEGIDEGAAIVERGGAWDAVYIDLKEKTSSKFSKNISIRGKVWMLL
jgi:hypothetical protein